MLSWFHRNAREPDDEGFTLIELLVVIVIIGILAAIAIPVFISQRKKAVEASVKSDVKNAITALESYYATYRTYPASTTLVGQGSFSLGSEQVVVSPGNTLTYKDPTAYGVTDAYCVSGSNPNSTATWLFKSDVGYLQQSATTC